MSAKLANPEKKRIICNNIPYQKVRLISYIHPFNTIVLDTYMSWVALDHGEYYIENMEDINKDVSVQEVYINPDNAKAETEAFLNYWRKVTSVSVN